MATVRINSLDTLRAAAIGLVLVAHGVLGFGAPAAIAPLQLGGIGVDLFFVLSGWLLGNVLFKEMMRGRLDVKRFWVRRWMRTLPAYYVVLTLTILQQMLTKENPALRWDYYFFIQNYNQPLPIFSVSWSLAVEEQFYLFIAPFLFCVSFFQKQVRLFLLCFLFLLPSVFRGLGYFDNLEETHVRIDGCILGVLLACVRHEFGTLWRMLERSAGGLFLVSLFAFFIFFFQRWNPLPFVGDPGILARAIMFGCWVVYANSSSERSVNLYFPGANYIATRSYAMYLLHPDAIAIINRLFDVNNFIVYFSAVLVLTAFLSEILYRFVEYPFMEMRSKLKVSR